MLCFAHLFGIFWYPLIIFIRFFLTQQLFLASWTLIVTSFNSFSNKGSFFPGHSIILFLLFWACYGSIFLHSHLLLPSVFSIRAFLNLLQTISTLENNREKLFDDFIHCDILVLKNVFKWVNELKHNDIWFERYDCAIEPTEARNYFKSHKMRPAFQCFQLIKLFFSALSIKLFFLFWISIRLTLMRWENVYQHHIECVRRSKRDPAIKC